MELLLTVVGVLSLSHNGIGIPHECKVLFMCPPFCMKVKDGCYVCDCGSLSGFLQKASNSLSRLSAQQVQTGSQMLSMSNTGGSRNYAYGGYRNPSEKSASMIPVSNSGYDQMYALYGGHDQGKQNIGFSNSGQQLFMPGMSCGYINSGCPSACWKTDIYTGCITCACGNTKRPSGNPSQMVFNTSSTVSGSTTQFTTTTSLPLPTSHSFMRTPTTPRAEETSNPVTSMKIPTLPLLLTTRGYLPKYNLTDSLKGTVAAEPNVPTLNTLKQDHSNRYWYNTDQPGRNAAQVSSPKEDTPATNPITAPVRLHKNPSSVLLSHFKTPTTAQTIMNKIIDKSKNRPTNVVNSAFHPTVTYLVETTSSNPVTTDNKRQNVHTTNMQDYSLPTLTTTLADTSFLSIMDSFGELKGVGESTVVLNDTRSGTLQTDHDKNNNVLLPGLETDYQEKNLITDNSTPFPVLNTNYDPWIGLFGNVKSAEDDVSATSNIST